MSTPHTICRLPMCAVLLAGLVALGSRAALPPTAVGTEPGSADPIPIRRVLLTPEQVAAELEKVKQGALKQLSRDEFEERVRRASEAGDSQKHPPQLVEARYMARLVDTSLQGTAEWKILNPTPRPGILAVGPFNLALMEARWPDKSDAVLGDLEGKELGLLVEAAGPSSLLLEWSARSVPSPPALRFSVGSPSTLRFSLEVPPCALASLELDLPADRVVSAGGETYFLTGPLPAADGNRRTWRINFAGRGQVTFDVRRIQGPGLPGSLVLSRLQSHQVMTPGQLQADYDFDLDVLHGGVRELHCECSAVLRPYEVTIRNLASWELRPPTGKTNPAVLIIRLREPFQGGPLQVRCLAPLAAGSTWTSPGVRLLGAVPRGETLNLSVHQGVQLEDWQPGGFRTSRAVYQPDGRQLLTLTAGLDAGANPTRPGARIQTTGPEYRARQYSWWNIDSDRASFTTQIGYEISHGRLFSLPLSVPNAWVVEQVELVPADLLQHWTVVPGKLRAMLQVDLQRPLDPASGARLTVRLRPAQRLLVPASGASLPIPDVLPLDFRTREGGQREAVYREGALGISVSSLYQASAAASLPAVPIDLAEDREPDPGPQPRMPAPARPPWGKQPVDFYYSFQGQGVDGTLQLRARTIQVRARCQSDVVIASGRALVMTRLELRPDVGTPQHIDLFVAGPPAGSGEWKTIRGTNSVTQVQRYHPAELGPPLAVLAARNPVQALAALTLPQRGSWWRLTLAQPLREPVTLEASFELADQGPTTEPALRLASLASQQPLAALLLSGAGQHLAELRTRLRYWEVPLLAVPGSDRFDGLVTLHLAGGDLIQVHSEGLFEVLERTRPEAVPRDDPASTVPTGSSSWRTFRYGAPPVALTVSGGVIQGRRANESVVDRASLSSQLRPDGRLLHRFCFQLTNWQQPGVPVRLPAGARLLAARSGERWLTRLPAGEAANGTMLHELPVVGGAARDQFEILYTTDQPAWSVWTTLEAPVPLLPVRTLAFRRTWRLPAGVAPLQLGSLVRVPSGSEANLRADESPFTAALLGPDSVNWQADQEQVLADAIAALRKQHPPDEDWPLGKALDRLAFDHLKARPLVVDTRALNEAGLGRTTFLGRRAWEGTGAVTSLAAPWENIGLLYVPCRPALLLTTRAQGAAWQTAPGAWSIPRPIEAAVAEAAAVGHDRSGRFRTILDWLQFSGPQTDGPPDASPLLDVFSSLGTDWTEWEPMAGTEPTEKLGVIRQNVLLPAGMVLAGLLTCAALGLVSPIERRRRRIMLAWLLAAGLALLWTPSALRQFVWPSALAGIAVSIWWTLRPLRLPISTVGTPVPAAAALCTLLASTLLPADAPPTTGAATVWLLPADSAPQQVLVPPNLLTQLDALQRRGAAGLRGAVLNAAIYKGQVQHPDAMFEATFHVHSFAEEATISLPLSGIELREAYLDNATAYLGKNYSVRLQGRGPHQIALRFTVPVSGTGDQREFHFGIPEVPRSTLNLRVGGKDGYLYAVEDERQAKGAPPAQVRGAQQVNRDGQSRFLKANLGAVKMVAARWQRADAPPAPVDVTVRESYYWHLQASAARLLAILQYTVSKGAQKTFELDIPPEIEVQSVEASHLPDGPPAPRLQEWQLQKLKDGSQRLRLDFHVPVTHGVQVSLELVPKQAFGRTAVLPFPTPVNVTKQVEGFLAYRTDGLEAAVSQHNAISGIDKPALTTIFAEWMAGPWRQAREEDLLEPSRAFSRRKGGILHLILRPPSTQARCVQDVTWRVTPRQAVLRAAAKITVPDNSLAFLEWEVPSNIAVSEVSGPQVHHWTRTGPRIQVWLQRPVAEAHLQLAGWITRSAKDQAQFVLPAMRVLDMQKQTSTLHLATADGLSLTPGKLQNLTERPELRGSTRELVYETDQEIYSGTFKTSTAAAGADFHVLSFAEVQERFLVVRAHLLGTLRHGELRTLTVTLRNWDGDTVELSGLQIARQVEKRQGSTGRTWVVELKPGVDRECRLTLSGRLPLGTSHALFLPDVRIETPDFGPIRLERWIAVAGKELLAERTSGLEPVADPAEALKPWTPESERVRRTGGLVWKVAAEDWRLRLRPRTPAPRSAAVHVFLAEQHATVGDGRNWLHHASYWLYHEAGAAISVALPEGGVLVGVAIDEAPVGPMQPDSGRLWLPLPGGAGVRHVRLTWAFPDGPVEVPNLSGPRLEGIIDVPALWVVSVPAGYQALRRPGGKTAAETPKPTSPAGTDLARAAAQVRLLEFLLERSREASPANLAPLVLAAAERIERHARHAEHLIGLEHSPGANVPAELQALRNEQKRLLESSAYQQLRNEIKAAGGDGRPPALSLDPPTPWAVSPLEQGRPAYWQGSSAQTPPLFRLVPEEAARVRQAATLSTVLLVLLFASWILWRSFRGAAWPEQLALLGGLGVLIFGQPWGLVFLILPAVWAGVRLVQLAGWVQALLPGRPLAVEPPGSSAANQPPAAGA